MMATYGDQANWPGLTLRQLLGKVDLFNNNCWSQVDSMGKQKGMDDWGATPNPHAAFLGPHFWDKKISMATVENEGWNQSYNKQGCFKQIEVENPSPSPPHMQQQQQQQNSSYYQGGLGQYNSGPQQYSCMQAYGQQQKVEQQPQLRQGWTKQEIDQQHETGNINFNVTEADLALATVPGADFDPKNRKFSPEELKPQPIIRKRKKVKYSTLEFQGPTGPKFKHLQWA